MSHIFPAPAKINLYLRITRIRPDGMHELDTAFAYTDLCDQLSITASDQIEVTCSERHLSGEKNLVYKILTAFRAKHSIGQGLHVHIDKRIPEQAGLGGGSSDAATALMAANQLWGVHASTDELIDFATPFGADIPCFLYGRASLARGIGEKLQDYSDPLPASSLLIARPATGLCTAEVFRHFDNALTGPETLDTIRRDSPGMAENDLEKSACSLSPDVEKLLLCMRKHSEKVWMSGSGSACVALFDQPVDAKRVSEMLKQQHLATWTFTGCINANHPLNSNIGT